MKLSIGTILLSGLCGSVATAYSLSSLQQFLGFKEVSDAHDIANLGNSGPLDNLFEVVSNENYASHRLRVKHIDPLVLGLDKVKQVTGYLDIEDDKHLFYWFFESRNDPQNDPVVLWLNGGPGCSSSTGLFFELGPSFINSTFQPEYNPYSWNSNASVIFLDQPVDVGLSYSDDNEVSTTAAAAKDVYIFLELFFQKFPQFQSRDFHMAGESYAGHYIPKFASEILSHPERSFNVTSVLIGNGFTDAIPQYKALIGMGCGQGGYDSILSEQDCKELEENYYPKCKQFLELCNREQDALTCVPAYHYCETRMFIPFSKTNLNPYDIREECERGGTCYEELDDVDAYLNLDFVRSAIGVSPEVKKYEGCSDVVSKNFALEGDKALPHQQYVAELLEKEVAVLIFAGDKDYRCNWLGNYEWTDQLDYDGHDEFSSKPLVPWQTSDGSIGGEYRNYEKFTYLRFYDAGHLVPHDQPQRALEMVNSWLQGQYSLN
ncbi:hypothetical protein G9P44_003917 [Scheffersomyces stipitis]|nr:hypothetical protein G9P44_003917 [Scheffersomyces stipitis]